LPRNARLRAYLVAATAAAFLVSVGPATPAAVAATPTTSTVADAIVATTGPEATATTVIATPTIVATTATPGPIAATTAVRTTTAARTITSARTTTTPADQVIAIAKSKLGDRWAYGAAGPGVFDCSGLVIYSFKKAGVASIVGFGRFRSARALYAWFRDRGLASRTNGLPGDLVIWGGGTHVGIYLGNGMAISTLVNGVRVHSIRATTARFTAFLHTGIAGTATTAVPRTAQPTAVVAKAATVTARRVTTTALRLRSGPSTATRVLSTLAAHAKVGVVRVAKDRSGRTWYGVLVGGRLGWLAGWYTRAI
jgi:cell wall-associated NlpC family hydrolase